MGQLDERSQKRGRASDSMGGGEERRSKTGQSGIRYPTTFCATINSCIQLHHATIMPNSCLARIFRMSET